MIHTDPTEFPRSLCRLRLRDCFTAQIRPHADPCGVGFFSAVKYFRPYLREVPAMSNKLARVCVVLLLLPTVLSACCRSAPPGSNPHPATRPASTIETLRDAWARARAYEISEAHGLAYDAYRQARPHDPRGAAFQQLVLLMLLTQPLLTGRDCLDLLGPPDLWGPYEPGRLRLFYFDATGEVVFHIREDGTGEPIVGVNRLGIREWERQGYRP
jgi:hypothetical protein